MQFSINSSVSSHEQSEKVLIYRPKAVSFDGVSRDQYTPLQIQPVCDVFQRPVRVEWDYCRWIDVSNSIGQC